MLIGIYPPKCALWGTPTWDLVSKSWEKRRILSEHLPEFRLHRKVTNPAHVIGFLSQWKMYLEQMPDREGGKYYKGRKLDTTVIEKVCVGPSWTEWTTDIWFRCHRNNWASSTNSCNPQRRFGLPRDHDSLHVLLTYDKMCECLHTISRLSRQNAPDAYTNINDLLMIHWITCETQAQSHSER